MSNNLTKVIKEKATEYYTGNPTISDKEFDELVEQLREKDPNNEIFDTVGWGYDIKNVSMSKQEHRYGRVGSLKKIRVYEELEGYSDCVLSAKLDGLSCVAYFEKGKLTRALTRGDGITGLDITDKFSIICKTKSLVMGNFTGAIRGELIMDLATWDTYQYKYPEAKNPRNVVAGLINRKLVSDDISLISFVTYKIHGEDEIIDYNSLSEMLERLNLMNFKVVKYLSTLIGDDKDIINKFYISNLAELYPIDGVVISKGITKNIETNGFDFQDIAFKFKSETNITTVKSIEWNLTRTSRLVPVLEIDEINLSGANIKRVTAFNAQFVLENKLGPGAVIEIERSGEVIPDIQKVIEPASAPELISYCPSCDSKLIWKGVDLVCDNENCVSKYRERLKRFITVNALVDGIGDTMLEEYINFCGVVSLEQLYSFIRKNKKNLLSLFKEKFGDITSAKFVEMSNNLLKDIDPVKFIVGLNISLLGWVTCEKIVAKNGLFDMIISSETKKSEIKKLLEQVKNVGEAVVDKILDNLSIIRSSSKLVSFIEIVKTDVVNDKELKSICVTGSLSMSRKNFDTLVRKSGYKVSSAIKSSEYLITNDPTSNSSKNVQAQELGKEILTEEEFLNKIKEVD